MTREMKLDVLAGRLQAQGLLREARDIGELAVSDIVYDSRQVVPGSLFLCKGAAFKPDFIRSARAAGAVAVLAEEDYPEAAGMPFLLVSDSRRAMGVCADLFFDSPWRKLYTIAVTGTKGKSTTATMLKAIYDAEAVRLGTMPCGITSSARIFDGAIDIPATLTTPETVDLYRYLARAVDNGIQTMVVEVSSQALKYGRVAGIEFSAGVFLNIAPDHIGPIEHPDFDDYFASKLHLFDVCTHAFINRRSDRYEDIVKAAQTAAKVTVFSAEVDDVDVWAADVAADRKGLAFLLCRQHSDPIPIRLPMHGRFNIDNALAAAAVALDNGVSAESVQKALAATSMPGHMQYLAGDDLTVVIDYAHNDISFRSVFETVAKDFPDAPRIVLFGAPGNKAESRRENLGEVASREADQIYLTTDDPARESVADINAEIRAAFVRDVPVLEIVNRHDAIRQAILDAPAGAVVLLLGKGNERAQKVAGGEEPWEGDEPVARRILEERARLQVEKDCEADA